MGMVMALLHLLAQQGGGSAGCKTENIVVDTYNVLTRTWVKETQLKTVCSPEYLLDLTRQAREQAPPNWKPPK